MTKSTVLKYFEEICKIPHTSGNEKQIREYIVNWLKQKKHVEFHIDKTGNLYIRKNGKIKTNIIYQAHMDMVGAKTTTSKHNFEKDPINFYYDDKYIRAKETTLGADDGTGVAIIMSLIDEQKISEYSFEALLTVEEETSCVGAMKLEKGWFKNKYLINLDSESDDTITIGSASGRRMELVLPIKRTSKKNKVYLFSISGGKGGHSGAQIHDIRSNVVIDGFVILNELLPEYKDLLILKASGGQVSNAIPNSLEIYFTFNGKIKEFSKKANIIFEQYKKAHEEFEKDLKLNIDVVDDFDLNPLDRTSTEKLTNLIVAANNGMNTYSFKQKLVTSSNNLGVLTMDDKKASLIFLTRSSYQFFDIKGEQKIKALGAISGAKYIQGGKTAGLTPMLSNPLANFIVKTAKQKFKHEMKIESIHAGLEFGYICEKYPHMIPVSIGPNMWEVHTPNEYVEVKSFNFMYELLLQIMINSKSLN